MPHRAELVLVVWAGNMNGIVTLSHCAWQSCILYHCAALARTIPCGIDALYEQIMALGCAGVGLQVRHMEFVVIVTMLPMNPASMP
jgi:hypothetical protein